MTVRASGLALGHPVLHHRPWMKGATRAQGPSGQSVAAGLHPRAVCFMATRAGGGRCMYRVLCDRPRGKVSVCA
eukprot:11897808-Alexandrium_andersonii.AAC.1